MHGPSRRSNAIVSRNATLTLSLAATVAALDQVLIKVREKKAGHLGAWFTSASSPKYSPCLTSLTAFSSPASPPIFFRTTRVPDSTKYIPLARSPCLTTSWPLAKAWLTSASAMFSLSYFSRCFRRETFSRKDSYILRFWKALLRTIFLNVERSIAHREPLV